MSRNKLRTHWATTYCGPHMVKIFENAQPAFTDKYEGTTCEARDIHDAWTIDIADFIFASPAKFNEVLLHEMVHVLEGIHDHKPAMFSIKSVGECTALAKTIGSGLGEMLTRLEQRPQRKKRGKC